MDKWMAQDRERQTKMIRDLWHHRLDWFNKC